jgi:ribose 1,5-bisphosphokinase
MNRRLIYVVGPSGAGKDSLLSWLRDQTPVSAPVHWARRTINRSKSDGPGAEDHVCVDTAGFELLVSHDEFSMHWDANTHRYGIPKSELILLRDPAQCVIVNGSRAHLPIAAHDYPGLTVLHITADPVVLRERLNRRGRESAEQIEARLSRNVELAVPRGCVLIEIRNDATLDIAGQQLLERLREFSFWPMQSS